MKKILSVLAAFGFVASAGTTVVACGNKQKPMSKEEEIKFIKDDMISNLEKAKKLALIWSW